MANILNDINIVHVLAFGVVASLCIIQLNGYLLILVIVIYPITLIFTKKTPAESQIQTLEKRLNNINNKSIGEFERKFKETLINLDELSIKISGMKNTMNVYEDMRNKFVNYDKKLGDLNKQINGLIASQYSITQIRGLVDSMVKEQRIIKNEVLGLKSVIFKNFNILDPHK